MCLLTGLASKNFLFSKQTLFQMVAQVEHRCSNSVQKSQFFPQNNFPLPKSLKVFHIKANLQTASQMPLHPLQVPQSLEVSFPICNHDLQVH